MRTRNKLEQQREPDSATALRAATCRKRQSVAPGREQARLAANQAERYLFAGSSLTLAGIRYNILCINLHSNTTTGSPIPSTLSSTSPRSNTPNRWPTLKGPSLVAERASRSLKRPRDFATFSGSSGPSAQPESSRASPSSSNSYRRNPQPGKRIDLLVFEIIKYFHSHSDSNITLDYLSEKLRTSS